MATRIEIHILRNLALLLGISAALAAPAYADDASKRCSPEISGLTTSRNEHEIAWMLRSQESVRSALRDPSSARFRNVYYCGKMAPLTCGEVNANNGFGGKGGFQHFISAGPHVELTYLEEQVADFPKAWRLMCQP